MTSTVDLFKSCKILPNNNFKVDDIEDYLSTLDRNNILHFQYIKHALHLVIKIDNSQALVNPIASNNYNYCAIQNGTEKVYYYFITEKKQLGESTVALSLLMDTINTFTPSVDFNFDDKTKINRQHKDRFTITPSVPDINGSAYFNIDVEHGREYELIKQNDEWIGYDMISHAEQILTVVDAQVRFVYFDSETGTLKVYLEAYEDKFDVGVSVSIVLRRKYSNYGLRKIDLASEGLTPMLYGLNKGNIEDKTKQKWYLVYYNSSNVINCYLYAENPTTIQIQGSGNTILPADLTAGTYYYIIPDENSNKVGLTTDNGTDVSSKQISYWTTAQLIPYEVKEKYVTCYYLSGADIRVRVLKFVWTFLNQNWVFSGSAKDELCNEINIDDNVSSIVYHSGNAYSQSLSVIRGYTMGTITLTLSSVTIPSINYLDKTEQDLIKIIELPYRPTDDHLTGWRVDNQNRVFLNNISSALEETIESDITPYKDMLVDLSSIADNDLRSALYESKLYHSDYFQYKFIYDSFSFIFALEKINTTLFNYYDADKFIIEFNATNTINSRMLFTFTQYVTEGKSTEDYNNILYVARNNEVVIYNSAYINYIKTGYNYDVKTKDRRELGLWAGTALGMVGSIASFAFGGPVGAGVGISLATSSMNSLINAVNSTAQAEANQEQKMIQLRHQRASISGADDLDLMNKYTGNRAKVMLYQCSERVQKTLYDLFFYTGYIDGTLGVPDTSSRLRFNFISVEPVYNFISNIPDEIVEDMTLKYEAGVTFLHCYNSSWDWEQKYENWEAWLFN